MLSTSIARFNSVLVYLAIAAVVMFAPAAGAQREDVLSRRDLAGAPPVLADAIAQLRPHWLQAGVSAAGVRSAAVFLNGRYLGGAGTLHTINTADVISARTRDPRVVRSTDPRFPRQEFDVAIYVATRSARRETPTGRVTVSVGAGFNVIALHRVTDEALSGAGFDQDAKYRNGFITPFKGDRDRSNPASVGVSVHYGVRGPWGLALSGAYTAAAEARGYSAGADTAVTMRVSSSEAALLATGTSRAFRLGVGPVYRRAEQSWVGGFCQCKDPRETASSALGLAAEGVVEVPIGPAFPSLRVLARYYPRHQLDYGGIPGPVDVGGLFFTMGLDLGVRF